MVRACGSQIASPGKLLCCFSKNSVVSARFIDLSPPESCQHCFRNHHQSPGSLQYFRFTERHSLTQFDQHIAQKQAWQSGGRATTARHRRMINVFQESIPAKLSGVSLRHCCFLSSQPHAAMIGVMCASTIAFGP